MKNKGIIIIMSIIIIILTTVIIILLVNDNNQKESDATKFKKEYTLVEKDNKFVYSDINKIINVLENGTGIVYLGFPECKWCQQYVVYLNELATERNISKIYYYNIRKDREKNTENYQKIVHILKDYLEQDEKGNPRIYVPATIVMSNGKILGFDDETAYDTKGYENPKEYWTNKEVKDLKNRLNSYLDKSNICFDCNS